MVIAGQERLDGPPEDLFLRPVQQGDPVDKRLQFHLAGPSTLAPVQHPQVEKGELTCFQQNPCLPARVLLPMAGTPEPLHVPCW